MTPSSARRLGMAFVAALVVVSVAACGTGSMVTGTIDSIGGPQIVAANLAFDRTTLTVPAGEAFELELVNRDGAPHNVSIYRDATAADRLFGGDVVSGPASRVYEIPALPAGTWYFRCDVHPDMHGEVSAAPTSSASPARPSS
jgi:plastocyanin